MSILEPSTRPLDEPRRIDAPGPLVRLEAPAGGPVWVVTSAELARQVLGDARFAKDPALAPHGWDRRSAGLEPTAAEQMSLTTLDGEPHTALRKAFAPLFSARSMDAAADRIRSIARRLLAEVATGEVDLVADFSTRYPLTVLGELLGVPDDLVGQAMTACRLMHLDYPAHVGEAMGGFGLLAGAALANDGLASALADRMPPGSTRADLEYQVFTLLFAGQLTTDPSVGFLVARLLNEPGSLPTVVDDTLTEHPPAPVSLWRFTSTDLELAGVALPAHTPVLVDIEGIDRAAGSPDLVFGAGAHYCIGARLARLELQILAETLTSEYPHARLLTPYEDLRAVSPGGIMGSRLTTLPVTLSPR